MRGFLITAAMAIVLAGATAWILGLWQPVWHDDNGDSPSPGNSSTQSKDGKPIDYGPRLYKLAVDPPVDQLPPGGQTLSAGTILIPGSRLVVFEEQTVASTVDGELLFIGKEVSDASKLEAKTATATYEVADQLKIVRYRPWEINSLVRPGEMVALINPGKAELAVQKAERKIQLAKSEYEAAEATYHEADAQLKRMEFLKKINPNAVAEEELGLKRLTKKRQKLEMLAKDEARKMAVVEHKEAIALKNQHYLKNRMIGAGVVKAIFKKRGDKVKAFEPILQLQNTQTLRAEGLARAGDLLRIEAFADRKQPRDSPKRYRRFRIRVEPVYEQTPWRVLHGHRAEVTAVAFTADPKNMPLMITADRRGLILVWDYLYRTLAKQVIYSDSPVRVLACSPARQTHTWFATGCVDGTVQLWDLQPGGSKKAKGAQKSPAPVIRWTDSEHHRAGGVTAVAFSPDGKYLATGGEDRAIVLRETATGKVIYIIDDEHYQQEAHQGPITSLHFTPGESRLVSASRDKSLRVWALHKNRARLLLKVEGRSGSVSQLGVSKDGRYMLCDLGPELHLLSTTDSRMMSVLSGASAGTTFETLALFSPDSRLLLTAGAPDGRLQLWKRPPDGGRGIELQQWATNEGSPVTCAAFAPVDGEASDTAAFAASGCQNGVVYLWRLPTEDEVRRQSITDLELNLVDTTIGTGGQGRIGVNVPNPDGLLRPGAAVTIIIELPWMPRPNGE